MHEILFRDGQGTEVTLQYVETGTPIVYIDDDPLPEGGDYWRIIRDGDTLIAGAATHDREWVMAGLFIANPDIHLTPLSMTDDEALQVTAWAKGFAYARARWRAGETLPDEPLNGEWADELSHDDVLAQVLGYGWWQPSHIAIDDDTKEYIVEWWLQGYGWAANDELGVWEYPHGGHPMMSGGWWCDTCNSPLCDLA
jgi:hypothetical protein